MAKTPPILDYRAADPPEPSGWLSWRLWLKLALVPAAVVAVLYLAWAIIEVLYRLVYGKWLTGALGGLKGRGVGCRLSCELMRIPSGSTPLIAANPRTSTCVREEGWRSTGSIPWSWKAIAGSGPTN
jgi:hypothetical protein